MHEHEHPPGTPPEDIRAWRNVRRRALIQARFDLPRAARRAYARAIAGHLETLIGQTTTLTIGGYCAIRSEPELGAFMRRMRAAGHRIALPVVVARDRPLEFRLWEDGDALERGVWNIPVPAAGAPCVTPDVVIAPVVGFDRAGYRLGNGGGFFDRTLAVMSPRPRALGVGYAHAELATIHPQPHDVPMDVVVTEHGLRAPRT